MEVIFFFDFFNALADDEVRAREGEMEDERGGRSVGRKYEI